MNRIKAKTFYVITFGCQMNYSDSDRITAILEEHGLRAAKSELKADLVVINSCSVRQMAEDRTYGKIEKLSRLKKRPRIVATGCLVSDKIWKKMLGKNKFDLCLPIDRMIDLPKYLTEWGLNKNHKSKIKYQTAENILSSSSRKRSADSAESASTSGIQEKLKSLPPQLSATADELAPPILGGEYMKYKHYLDIIPKAKQTFSAYIPIMTGCNNFCSYCAVPYTRGREVSRPMQDILNEAKRLADQGCVELTLLGQNVNSYGNNTTLSSSTGSLKGAPDRGSKSNNTELRISNYELHNHKNNFVELLSKISDIKGLKRIFFISSHPKDMSDDLIKLVAERENICNYIHLPLQSGSTRILKKMNRHYTKEQYLELVDKIRRTIFEVVISTDVIVGFPGETKNDFADSCEVFEKAQFDMAYIAEYSPRPKTVASKIKNNVSRTEKKRRKYILNDLLGKSSLKNNNKLIGTIIPVLITDKSKDGLIGLTEGLKQVYIKGDKKLIGLIVPIKITKAMSWALEGIII